MNAKVFDWANNGKMGVDQTDKLISHKHFCTVTVYITLNINCVTLPYVQIKTDNLWLWAYFNDNLYTVDSWSVIKDHLTIILFDKRYSCLLTTLIPHPQLQKEQKQEESRSDFGNSCFHSIGLYVNEWHR